MKKTIIEKGFLVTFNYVDGSAGFLGIDDHSGGYPFFTETIDRRKIRKNPLDVVGDLNEAKGMKTYYHSDKVNFDTMRIVQYSQVFEEVDLDYDDMMMDSIMGKLSSDEMKVLKRNLDKIGES